MHQGKLRELSLSSEKQAGISGDASVPLGNLQAELGDRLWLLRTPDLYRKSSPSCVWVTQQAESP